MIVGNLLAFACAVPFALPPSGDGTDWALILYLGIVQIAIAYLLLTAAVRWSRRSRFRCCCWWSRR